MDGNSLMGAGYGKQRWREFVFGMRDCVPVAFSVGAYGLVFGVLARQKHLGAGEVFGMSGLVFSGTAQFVALDQWIPPLPLIPLLSAVLVVSLRYVLICASCQPLFAGVGRLRALGVMFLVCDESWAMTMGRRARDGSVGAMHLFGGGVLVYLMWLASSVAGDALGRLVPDPARWGLDFAFTAALLALLTGMWRSRSDLLPWAVAGIAATAASLLLPGKWYILVGGLAGSLCGSLRRAD